MRIDVPTREDVIEVALNMRQQDREELLASGHYADDNELISDLAKRYGVGEYSYCAYLDDKPVIIGAVIPTNNPGELALCMFATDDFRIMALFWAKFVTRRLLPKYNAEGFVDAMSLSLSTYTAAHRWMTAIGMARVKDHPGIGSGGEDFIEFRKAL